MELSLTRASLQRGSDTEPNDGFQPSHTPRLALGNGSNGASGGVLVAEADRPLWVRSGDLRTEAWRDEHIVLRSARSPTNDTGGGDPGLAVTSCAITR